jgi:hypothetical protein
MSPAFPELAPIIGVCATATPHQNVVMDSEKFEAIGQRGEACIILKRRNTLPNGQAVAMYTLATGERLRATDVPGQYTTMDGARTFRLRKQP